MTDSYRRMDAGMNEIIPNLWLGDLHNATDANLLKSKNIHSILSVMRGKLSVAETFIRHQIQLDDTEEEDVLKHLVVAITFIEAELEKDRGVLVHCMAGVSRSVTIVAAYLMYAQGIDPTAALEIIRAARPVADPNSSFLNQLEIFYQASCKVSQHDRGVRKFYLDRMVKDILKNDGTADSELLSTLPSVSSYSTSSEPRRRIRCKMCRTELASRENMLDHGHMNPPSPSVSYSPTVPSIPIPPRQRGLSEPSLPQSRLDAESKSTMKTVDEATELGQQLSESLSIAESKDAENSSTDGAEADVKPAETIESPTPKIDVSSVAFPSNPRPPVIPSVRASQSTNSGLAHPSDLSAELFANPTIAALRGINVVTRPSPLLSPTAHAPYSPPILANSKCSGYFVEPLKWMEPFLEQGQLAGKIMCPNKKCNAKLGNYDWAGVCCSCKEWVVPGFCIHRSKVDEIM